MRFVLLPLLAFTAVISAPLAHADDLDDKLTQEMARRHVPGLSVLVIRDGKVIKEKGYGYANVEHSVPVDEKTVFQSGSIGKTFTAALVMLLAEDGKLSLEDPISRHLANTPPEWAGITIRHLLTHTSGLGDPYKVLDFRKDYSDEELIALEATIPVLFAPGESYSYSNMGYHLLGFICNKVGGKFYGEQLRERIFAPLGMGTRIISEADIVPHRAAGYVWKDGTLSNQSWVAPKLNTTADGSLYLTARDLAKWDQALYGDTILNARIRAASWTPPKLANGRVSSYGYGWEVDELNGHRLVAHSGAWQGFKSQISRFVDDKFTVIVLANSARARPGKFAGIIAGHFIPALAVEPAKAIADANPEVASRARTAVTSLIAGKQPTMLAPAVAKIYDPELLARYSVVLKEFGELKAVELLSRKDEAEAITYRYRFIFAEETLILTYQLDKEQQVTALRLFPE